MFKPGQSGNPGGRPKSVAIVKEAAQAYGLEAIQKLAELMHSDNPTIARAAARDLLERGYGKPAQSVELSGPEGAALLTGISVNLVKPDASNG